MNVDKLSAGSIHSDDIMIKFATLEDRIARLNKRLSDKLSGKGHSIMGS